MITTAAAKRMPACEGIETEPPTLPVGGPPAAKRMPACEGIETVRLIGCITVTLVVRQEDARL